MSLETAGVEHESRRGKDDDELVQTSSTTTSPTRVQRLVKLRQESFAPLRVLRREESEVRDVEEFRRIARDVVSVPSSRSQLHRCPTGDW